MTPLRADSGGHGGPFADSANLDGWAVWNARWNFAMHPGRLRNGFTLLELIVTLSITAILIAIALPSFRDTLDRQRVTTALHLLSAQFAQARSTAIIRSEVVSVCPSRGDGRCREDGDWSEGWILYRDPGRDGQPDAPEEVLREERRTPQPHLRLRSSQGRHQLRYLPDGRSAGSNLRVRVCLRGRLQGEVVVNNLGRVRSVRAAGTQPCD